jgi:hypothetical protein
MSNSRPISASSSGVPETTSAQTNVPGSRRTSDRSATGTSVSSCPSRNTCTLIMVLAVYPRAPPMLGGHRGEESGVDGGEVQRAASACQRPETPPPDLVAALGSPATVLALVLGLPFYGRGWTGVTGGGPG